ncbi:MAG: hypothetical protein Q4B77_04820 [Coriobacteriaceae bacterium]|nr:hypothetical protein [Coriobacteriaceae bacterium]
MSKKTNKQLKQDKVAKAEEDARAMEAARELRERRKAAAGPAPIDNELHRSLPLTRVFGVLIVITFAMFLLAQLFTSQNNLQLAQVCSIAFTVLFLTSFVVWFASRHQAKKLTKERRGE